MNYATERLLAAARAALAYADEARTYIKHNPDQAEAMREELESALHYFDAHGDKPELAEVTNLGSFDYELLADALDVLDPDGSEATKRKQELEAWARQMAATGRGQIAERLPRVLVHLDGGVVQDILCDAPLRAVVIDYDTDGADEADLFDIPQDDGDTSEGFVSDWGTIQPGATDGQFIDQALEAEPSYPRALAKAHRAQAKRICQEQPGYGTPDYRGDPYGAVSLQQEADRLDRMADLREAEPA